MSLRALAFIERPLSLSDQHHQDTRIRRWLVITQRLSSQGQHAQRIGKLGPAHEALEPLTTLPLLPFFTAIQWSPISLLGPTPLVMAISEESERGRFLRRPPLLDFRSVTMFPPSDIMEPREKNFR
jgi:hypothetical protein